MRVLGSASAEALVRVGLDEATVVAALVREIGLTEAEAHVAYRCARPTPIGPRAVVQSSLDLSALAG
jgi:hypothetical protein